jgi:hypothetical protein
MAPLAAAAAGLRAVALPLSPARVLVDDEEAEEDDEDDEDDGCAPVVRVPEAARPRGDGPLDDDDDDDDDDGIILAPPPPQEGGL